MGIKAIQDNAVAISKVYKQEEQDADWIDNTPSIDYKLPEIPVDGTSTSTTLVEYDIVVAQGDNVRLYNATDGLATINLGVVTTNNGSIHIHDIFGDGSAVATYNLDGNANDLGGNYNGTVGSAILFNSGKFGGSASFTSSTASTNQIIIPSTVFDKKTIFSISYWTYCLDSVYSNNFNSYYVLGSTNNNAYDLNFSLAGLRAHGEGNLSASLEIANFSSLYTPNTWNHTLVTRDGATMKVYYNGLLMASRTDAGAYDSGTTALTKMGTGNDGNGSAAGFNGSIDQVRIFNRALTDDEVKTLYNETATKYTADISALNLTKAPTKAFFDKPVTVSTATEANANRCIAQDEILDKVSSTTTEFVGTNAISGLLQDGDSIQIDGTTDVVCSSVTETDVSVDSTNTHDIFGDGSAVATYNLDGDATDLSGNYNGTEQGTMSYTDAKFGQGQNASGVDSGLVIPWSTVSGTNPRTISMWVNLSTNDTTTLLGTDFNGQRGFGIFYTKDGTAISNGDGTAMNNNEWHIFNGGSSNSDNIGRLTDADMPIGEFVHLCFVMTMDNKVTIYRNSSSVGVVDVANFTVFNTDYNFPIYLGCNNYDDSIPANGSIFDQLRIFNRALTDDEVNTLYNEQIPKYQYKCTIPEQSTAPTSAKVLDRSTTSTEASDTYDDTTSKFTKIYNKIEKQGRAFKYKIETDTGVEIDKITIPMTKLG